jgi:2-polyprenyl-3-methyl-5-hydroxy-6-metoxy-1,4-benzoquinol methylase
MKCPVCSDTNLEKLFSLQRFLIFACKNCTLQITKNKSKISYSRYHRDTDYKDLSSHFKNIFQSRVNLLSKYVPKKGKVLDIGCSTGNFLDLYKSMGWETWGIEPSKSSQVALHKGHKVENTNFEDSKLPNNYFDLIIMNHTLEHLSEPTKITNKATKLLNKNGILFIDVPNVGSLRAKLYDKKWPYYLPDEHLQHFNKKSLDVLMKASNLKVVQFKSRSGIFEFANPTKEIFTSLFTLKKRFFNHILSFPIDLISTITNQGDSISVIAKKL